jgi:hypothetical protein
MNNIFSYFCLFSSPLPNRAPFFNECDLQTYGKLYGFRNIITKWSFSVFAYERYLHLMQNSWTALFLLLSNNEYVLSIELHHETFIGITVDSNT